MGAGTTDFGCLVGTFHNDSEGVMVIAAARRAVLNLWTFRYAGPPDISFRLIFRGLRFTAQDLFDPSFRVQLSKVPIDHHSMEQLDWRASVINQQTFDYTKNFNAGQ